MATVLVAHSRCECQAMLSARLTPERFVLSGFAFRVGRRENAPAHSLGAENKTFDIGWLCPFCGRNVLRTFNDAGLQRVSGPDTPVPAAPTPNATP
jgi:hypothetical protein